MLEHLRDISLLIIFGIEAYAKNKAIKMPQNLV